MWVKTTCCNSSLSSFNKKLIFTIFCIGALLYQYIGFYLQKATTFPRFPDSPGRELQPPQLLYQPIHLLVCRHRPTEGSNLHLFSSYSWKGATTPQLLYWPICLLVRRPSLQNSMIFFLPRGTTFHKFSYWILLKHNTII